MLRIFYCFRFMCVPLISALIIEIVIPTKATAAEDIEVKNIRFEASGNIINIYYDLLGPVDQVYNVKITLKRRQNLQYDYIPKTVTGDIGDGNFGGLGRHITWEILNEFPTGLEGNDYYFRIEAELISSGSNLLYYLGGGVVAVGAAIYFLVAKKTVVEEGYFPKPAGRPTGY